MTPRIRVRRRLARAVVGAGAAVALVIAVAFGALRPSAGHPAGVRAAAEYLDEWSPATTSWNSTAPEPGSPYGGHETAASSSWQ